jgi:phosphoadenosine phosphosulfate reductase
MLTLTGIKQLAETWQKKDPMEIVRLALQTNERIAISFSGAEDVVLIDMATQIRPDIAVFSLDTGRLHPQTYEFIDKVRTHYSISLDILYPDYQAVETFVRDKGLFSFYQNGHGECCQIRKVQPLRRKLQTLDAWITGQRRDQSPGTRSQVEIIESDLQFSTETHPLVKWNPLALWTSAQVWDYIRSRQIPFNELHLQGFQSIGCAPCTRPVLPGQHEREGRWWWESATAKECGLHNGQPKGVTA